MVIKETHKEYLWEIRLDKLVAEIDELVDQIEDKHREENHEDFYVTDIHIEKEAPHQHPITHRTIPEHFNITIEYEYERIEEDDA